MLKHYLMIAAQLIARLLFVRTAFSLVHEQKDRESNRLSFGYALSLTPFYGPLIYLCVFVLYIVHYNKCSVIKINTRAALTHSTFACKKNYMRYNTFYTFISNKFLLSSIFLAVVCIYFHLVSTYTRVFCV